MPIYDEHALERDLPTLRPQDDFMNGFMNGPFDREYSYFLSLISTTFFEPFPFGFCHLAFVFPEDFFWSRTFLEKAEKL